MNITQTLRDWNIIQRISIFFNKWAVYLFYMHMKILNIKQKFNKVGKQTEKNSFIIYYYIYKINYYTHVSYSTNKNYKFK